MVLASLPAFAAGLVLYAIQSLFDPERTGWLLFVCLIILTTTLFQFVALAAVAVRVMGGERSQGPAPSLGQALTRALSARGAMFGFALVMGAALILPLALQSGGLVPPHSDGASRVLFGLLEYGAFCLICLAPAVSMAETRGLAALGRSLGVMAHGLWPVIAIAFVLRWNETVQAELSKEAVSALADFVSIAAQAPPALEFYTFVIMVLAALMQGLGSGLTGTVLALVYLRLRESEGTEREALVGAFE